MEGAPRVIVVGQGYVGLPLAMSAVGAGHHVTGVDLDPSRVQALTRGESYVEDVDDETVRDALAVGRYHPTADYADVDGFDYAVITVPTPLLDGIPDLSYIVSAGRSLAPSLRRGSTVILESTTYPGTTEELLVPLLETGSGLRAGTDFSVGYSPERIDPGNKVWGFAQTPKVVSGIDPISLERVRDFYDTMVERTVPVSGTREAELTKLLENTFRHVNIALVNELAMFAHELDVDIWEAIDAASTKPFGYMRFTPGPGVGGHCLPVDPSYLAWRVKEVTNESFRFVELANSVNEHMPEYTVVRAERILAPVPLRGATVLVVGLAYKSDVGDVRESPGLDVVRALSARGARVLATDDHVTERDWPAEAERVALDAASVGRADLTIVVTLHDRMDRTVLEEADGPVFDTRGLLKGRVHRL